MARSLRFGPVCKLLEEAPASSWTETGTRWSMDDGHGGRILPEALSHEVALSQSLGWETWRVKH